MNAPDNTKALLTTEAAPLTMSSREIAELMGKEHKHVMRDIRTMLAELGEPEQGYVQSWTNPQNEQTYPEFHLDRELTDTLLTGYSAVLRRKVITRWHELEAGAPLRIPQTLAQALRLAADQADQLEAQAAQLAVAAPKVQFVDNYVSSTGNKGFREVCKLLCANEREFGAWLHAEGITYRLAGERTALQRHVDAGRFVTKAGTTGEGGHAYNQLKFTPKGVAWIAGEWTKHKVHEGGAT